MALLIFLFWVVLNGRLTAEIALFGLAIAAALYVFLWKWLDYKPRYDLVLLKSLPLAAEYLVVLLREVALAALTMAGFIFDHRDLPEPVIVRFRAPLRTGFARVLLANSISLTPGTITLGLAGGEFQVHCYDRSLAEGLDSSVFVRLLQRWEATL